MAEIRRLRMEDVTVVPAGLAPGEQAEVWATGRLNPDRLVVGEVRSRGPGLARNSPARFFPHVTAHLPAAVPARAATICLEPCQLRVSVSCQTSSSCPDTEAAR